MWLKHLEADRLRNLKAVNLDLSAEMTLICGRNGQGKTSLLESIYLLATGRSFRTRRTDELIGWDGGPLRVSGSVESRLGQSTLTVVMDGGKRSLLADSLELDFESFIGRLDVVDLTGDRIGTLRGGPEERRRFLDRGILGLRSGYLACIGAYRKVLSQRNALLRRGGGGGAEIEAWNERLARAGATIHGQRREYVSRLALEVSEFARELFPGGGELLIHYRPSPAVTGDHAPVEFAEIFKKSLIEGLDRDTVVGHTCRGPHRDDLKVELDGVDLRKYGSAGQVRASMVALKLGKLSLLKKDRGEAPLFLMDDFDSDLDEARATTLATFLQSGGCQALVATSKEAMADRLGVSFSKIRDDEGRPRQF